MSLPDRIRRRVIVLRYADMKHMVGINPLSLGRFVGDSLTRAARIVSKVGHVSRILLQAWGEKDFNSKPLLFKWTTRFLSMLARAGLTIADVRHFFDMKSPVYQSLTRTARDLVSQLEMAELAEMRPRDREEFIASTKNRFLGFLENPIVEFALGKLNETLDVLRLIQQHAIIIISLERGGVLRDEDVEIFANLWLNEVLYAAYNTPPNERVPHFIFLDELPVFQSSADLITRALAQVRKFQVRIVSAFQGTNLFAERTEDRLLNALISQCNLLFMFRHKNPVDAKFFGEIAKLPSIDLYKVKNVLKTPQQFQDGHDIVMLEDESDNWSDAEQRGGSQSDAASETTTQTSSSHSGTGTSESRSESMQLLSEAVNRAESSQSGTSSSNAAAHGTTRTDARNWANTRTRGGSVTRKTTLVPRVLTRDIVTSIQFFSTDEQIVEEASRVTGLSVGTSLLYIGGRGVVKVKLPLAKDPLRLTPRFAVKKLTQLHQIVYARPEFATPQQLLNERQLFEQRLVQYLDQQRRVEEYEPLQLDYEPTDDNPLLTF